MLRVAHAKYSLKNVLGIFIFLQSYTIGNAVRYNLYESQIEILIKYQNMHLFHDACISHKVRTNIKVCFWVGNCFYYMVRLFHKLVSLQINFLEKCQGMQSLKSLMIIVVNIYKKIP